MNDFRRDALHTISLLVLTRLTYRLTILQVETATHCFPHATDSLVHLLPCFHVVWLWMRIPRELSLSSARFIVKA